MGTRSSLEHSVMPSGGGLMALLRRERVSEPWQVPWWRRCTAFGALV